MKTLDLTAIVENVRKLGAIKETLEHLQEAYTESLSRIMLGLNAGSSDVVVLSGVSNGGILPDYAISAGSVYYNGEIYEVPVFSGTAGGGQVPVLTLQTTYKTGDPVRYSDNTDHFTHAIRKLVWSFGTSGTGIKDYSQLVSLGAKLVAIPELITQALTAENNAKAYADSIVVGLWDDRGNYNASTNLFPATGGSGSAGAIKKGDIWTVSVIGTLGGVAVSLGDTVRALVDTPAQTAANWAIAEANLGYTPENIINKDTDVTLAANSDTKYPSQKAIKTYADKRVNMGGGPNQLSSSTAITIGADSGDASFVRIAISASDKGRMVSDAYVDGVTIDKISTFGVLQVKDGGITLAKIAQGVLGIIGDIGDTAGFDGITTPGIYRIYALSISPTDFYNILIVGKNGNTIYQSRLYFSNVWVATSSGGAVTTNIQPVLGFEGRTSSDGGGTWTAWTHV